MKQAERIQLLIDALIAQTVDYGGYNFMTALDDFVDFCLDDPHIPNRKVLFKAWDECTDKDYATIINRYSCWYLKQLKEGE